MPSLEDINIPLFPANLQIPVEKGEEVEEELFGKVKEVPATYLTIGNDADVCFEPLCQIVIKGDIMSPFITIWPSFSCLPP